MELATLRIQDEDEEGAGSVATDGRSTKTSGYDEVADTRTGRAKCILSNYVATLNHIVMLTVRHIYLCTMISYRCPIFGLTGHARIVAYNSSTQSPLLGRPPLSQLHPQEPTLYAGRIGAPHSSKTDLTLAVVYPSVWSLVHAADR